MKNQNNDTYKYTMYTKTDPYGTVQRWVSDSIDGAYYQVDDRFYISEEFEESNDDNQTQCLSTENTTHYDRVIDYKEIDSKKDDKKVYKNHYEGAFIANFGDETIFYSDHYITDAEEEVGTLTDPNYLENKNKVAGIYYSVLEKNSKDSDGNDITDFGITDDHMRFNTFNKVNILNTQMRPTSSRENQIRNGTVLTISDEEDKDSIRNIIKNASDFNATIKKYKQNDNKVTVVIKSNRAISSQDADGNYASWYLDGWRYVGEMSSDSNVDASIKNNIYNYIDGGAKYTPYVKEELYIYKTFDEDINTTVKLIDFNYDTKTVKIENKVTGITIASMPNKTIYVKGTDLNLTGGKIKVTYEDGSTKEIDMTADMVTGYNKNTLEEQELTVTYEGKTVKFNVEVIILGDINGDKKLDVADLLLIKRHLIAGNKEEWKLEEKQQKYADIDNNGVVDVSDLLYLKRKLLNIY